MEPQQLQRNALVASAVSCQGHEQCNVSLDSTASSRGSEYVGEAKVDAAAPASGGGAGCFESLRQAVLAKSVESLRTMLDLPSSSTISTPSVLQEEEHADRLAYRKSILSTLDSEGLTVLHQAIFTKSVPVLSALIEAGGDVNARDEEGCTLLHTAAMVGNCLIAGWLLKEGANPTATDAEGLLPIDRTEDCGMEDLLLSAMSLAGYAQHRAGLACDFSEAEDSDYGTGTSSVGSFSEDEDGVLSLMSCTWEDDECSASSRTTTPDPKDQQLPYANDSSAEAAAESSRQPSSCPMPCLGTWRSQVAACELQRERLVPVSCGECTSDNANPIDHDLTLLHHRTACTAGSTAAARGTTGVACEDSESADAKLAATNSTATTTSSRNRRLVVETPSPTEVLTLSSTALSLADGVRMWQRLSSQSCEDASSPVSQEFRFAPVCPPDHRTSTSRNLHQTESQTAVALQDEEDIHIWSDTHRRIIFKGFQIVNKSHSDVICRVKVAQATARTAEARSSSPSHGVTRGDTVSESDFGWVLPKGRTQHHTAHRSILRHSSLNTGGPVAATGSLKRGSLASRRRRQVKFVPHVVLEDAVQRGDVDEVERLFSSSRIAVTTMLPSGLLPLHLAVLNRQRGIVQFLIAQGADVNGRDTDDWTPLHAAALEGTVPIANLLLEYHSNPLATTNDGRTPLMLASNANVRLVLQNASRDIMSKAAKQRRAWQESATLLDEDCDEESDISDDDSEGGSQSGEESDTEEDDETHGSPVRRSSSLLVSEDEASDDDDDDDDDNNDETAASTGGDAADLPTANPTDEEKALAMGLVDFVEGDAESDAAAHQVASIPAQESNDQSVRAGEMVAVAATMAPETAETNIEVAVAAAVVEEPAAPSTAEDTAAAVPGDTAAPSTAEGPKSSSRSVRFSPNILLRHAILNSNSREVEQLLGDFDSTELGLNLAEISGVTAVHQAVLEEATTILLQLLEDGRSDINAKDADGWTPLHAASAIGNLEITRTLLSHGASATVLSDEGKFAIELSENVELEGLLRQAMHTE
eukprot:scpid16540/ scgid1744/ Protein phosphatase 1 regulatory subunit 27; Dysferlin-interacting protein 1; Toonin